MRTFTVLLLLSVSWGMAQVVTTNADTGAGSLRAAITAANDGDIITFAAGLSGQTILLGSDLPIISVANLTIDASALASSPVTIDGNDSHIIFAHTGVGTFTINNLVVTRGRITGDGGGIYSNGNVTVINSTIEENTATQYGGGIFIQGGTVTIQDSNVMNNDAGDSVGGIVTSGGTIVFTGSTYVGGNTDVGTFLANASQWGGASATGAQPTTTQSDIAFGTPPVTATPTDVVNKLADTNDGSCDTLDCSLREAIANANDGDTITFNVSGTINLNSELAVSQANLTIDASGQNVTVSGQNSHRVFNHGSNGTFEVVNLLVTGGNTTGLGGGILSNGTVTVTNSTITGNSASSPGGGIFSNGNVTLTNSTITGNSASDGGGIFSNGNVTLTNSTITGNSASDGGGIFSGGTVTLTNSTIAGNSASFGGGILSIANVTLNNSTIAGNSASDDSGGILSIANVTLNNSLVLGNAAPTNPQIRADSGITLNNSAYGFAAGQSIGNSFVGFGIADVFTAPEPAANAPTTAGDYTLIACSPAINAGDNALAPAGNDLANNTRIQQTTVDMGAFESALNACIPTTIVNKLADTNDGSCDTADCSLREAIAAATNGDTITFDTSLSGGTITLALGELNTALNNLTIDASALANPVTIDANNASRVFNHTGTGTFAITNLVVTNGSAVGNGGGILSSGVVTVTNSTLSGNSATNRGGGIEGSGVTVTNSTLSGNSATNEGGGIWSFNGVVTVTNSTLSGNSAGNGGGIYSFSAVTLTNSLVLGNDAPANPQIRAVGGITTNNSAYGFAAGQSTGDSFVGFDINDVFTNRVAAASAPTTAGDYTLTTCSPAINTGNNGSVVGTTDVAGNTRIQAVTVDMGAFESNLQACQTIDFDLSGLPAKTYGDADFDISGFASATSGLPVAFDSATPAVCTVTGSTVSIITAGTCTIEADQTGDAEYQPAPQVTQDITIAQKDLTAVVNAANRDYGTANPAFTLTYTGLVPGDTAADIDVAPTLATTAVATSDAGTYPITCDTAPFADVNYTLSVCTAGTLTVEQVAVAVTAEDVTITEGDTPTFTATYVGFVVGDDETVLDTPVSFADTAPDYNTAGGYIITPSGAADVNYTFTYNPGTLTIQSAGFAITETGGNTAVTEGAGADTIEVVLTSVPTADVVITVTPDAQLDVGAGASTATDLTFTPANWDTVQTINVTANDDADIEGDHSGVLGFTVASGDANYDGATLADITAAITDDDAGVIVTPTTLTTAEGAAATSYDISLNTNPAGAITITITPDAQTDLGAGAGTAVDLTFNDTTPQTVNVTAVDDTDIEGAHSSTISHAITTGDGGDYPTTFVIDDVTVDITDNDAVNTGSGSAVNPNPDIQIRNGATTAAAAITSRTIEPLRYGTYKRGQAVTLNFLVRNPGQLPLTIGELGLPSFFSNIGDPLPATLASFQSALLTVEVDTSTAGTFTGQVSLASNDPDANENPFTFDVVVTVSNEPANAINVLPGIDLGVGSISAGQQDVVLLSFKVEVPAGSVPVDLEGIVLSTDSVPNVAQASNLRLYIDGGMRGVLDNRDVFVAELAGSDLSTLTFTFPTRTFQPDVPMWFVVVGDF